MNETSRSLVLVQMSMGDYRDSFVAHLLEQLDGEFEPVFFIGDHYFGKTTKTSEYIKSLQCRKKTYNLMIGNAFGWQWFNYLTAFKSDIVVLELNPRLLHTWLILLVRKALGRKTVLWGHLWARSGEGSITEPVRALLRNLSDRLLFYTAEQKQNQIRILDGRRSEECFVATNSLYNRSQIFCPHYRNRSFIYVGRLVADKKPILLVRSFIKAVRSLPANVKLHMVGAGPLEIDISKLIEENNLGKRIIMHGHIGDPDKLRNLYTQSFFAVSPGYVGLSAIQSLAFGRPILVSRNEPHAPELAALEEGFNSVFFETDSVNGLSDKLLDLVENGGDWEVKGNKIAENCAQNYSVEAMVDGFIHAIR